MTALETHLLKCSAPESTARRRSEVTIVIPVFNSVQFIEQALESALAQKPFVKDVIVVDDGSTDGTALLLHKRQSEISLLTQRHSGPAIARNRGWRAAKSAWIQFLDADDRIEPGAIGNLLSAADAHAGTIPFGLQLVYDSTFQGQPVLHGSIAPKSGNVLKSIALMYSATIFSALIPKSALEAVGGFAEDIWHGEDYELALKLAKRFPFTRLDVPTYGARMHAANRHRAYDQSSLNDFIRIVERELGPLPGVQNQLLYRQALANWYFYFGMLAKDADRSSAARLFLHAGMIQPWKIRAWKRWIECLFCNG